MVKFLVTVKSGKDYVFAQKLRLETYHCYIAIGMENTRGSYAHQRKKDRREGEEQSKSLGSPFSAFADGKVHTGFRISPVVQMLSKISGEKERVLREMKFDGLMHLPKGETESDRPFKLKFSLWLSMKLDEESGNLELGDRGCIPLKNADVGLVLGLSDTGEELEVHDPTKIEHNKEIIRRNLMLSESEELDLEKVKDILQRDISNDTDGALRRAFITAVVIYSVSYFLAPRGRPPRINTEIFDSITDPNRIFRLNWASYVLKTLRDSTAKVKSDILSGKSSVCLDGCLLFLQALPT